MIKKYRVNIYALLLIYLFTASCGSLLPKSDNEISYFILKDHVTPTQSNFKATNKRLIIANVKGNQFVDSQKIIFAKNDQTRGYYQFSNWVEPPTVAIARMVAMRLENTGIFSSVSTSGSAIGDYQLQIEVLEFYHDISQNPGEAIVKLQVEILNLATYQVMTRKIFSISQKTSDYSANGAVSAFNETLKLLFDEIIVWISSLSL